MTFKIKLPSSWRAIEAAAEGSSTSRHATPLVAELLLYRPPNHLLLARRANTGYEDGKLGLPGGHVEPAELLDQTACREAYEELGLLILSTQLSLKHVQHALEGPNDGERLRAFFAVDSWQPSIEIGEPDKCTEHLWVQPSQLPPDTAPHVAAALYSIARGILYSTFKPE